MELHSLGFNRGRGELSSEIGNFENFKVSKLDREH